MAEKRTPKRKRGGQTGNSNARRHGMYAAGLNAEQVSDYWKAREEGVEHVVAMFGAV